MSESPAEKRRKLVANLATISAQAASDILDSSSDSDHSTASRVSTSSESEDEETANSNSARFVAAMIRRKVPKSSTFFDVLQACDEIELRKHFRMNRETWVKLIEVLSPHFPTGAAFGNQALAPQRQATVGLWYLFNAETFRGTGARFGVCETSAHNYVERTVNAILSEKDNYLKWPNRERFREIEDGFFDRTGMPDCYGAIDGKHIRIQAPQNRPEDYINRKGFHSLVLQATTDDEMKFTSIYCGWPGSVHDARVFKRSPMYPKMRDKTLLPPNKFILGDAAYPLMPSLLTPFKDFGNLSQDQKHYNYKHSSTRMVVERAFGQLASRMRCLRCVDLDLYHVSDLVLACCVVHNVCILAGDVLDENELQVNNDHMNDEDDYQGGQSDNQLRTEGAARRSEIVVYLSRN